MSGSRDDTTAAADDPLREFWDDTTTEDMEREDYVPPPAATPERDAADEVAARVRLLEMCAAGRTEYAKNATPEHAIILKSEAAAIISAIRILSGDLRPAYGLIPSWRWHEAGLPTTAAAPQTETDGRAP